MRIDDALVQAALTGKLDVSHFASQGDSALEHLLRDLMNRADSTEPQRTLLRLASVLSSARLCGYVALPAEPLQAAAEPDQPVAPDAPILGEVLLGSATRLHHLLLAHVVRASRRLPSRHLVAALDLGSRASDMRPLVVQVIGTRGRWLATHDRRWAYAAEAHAKPDEDIWAHGSWTQRRQWLRELRAADAVAARTLVDKEMSVFASEQRADLASFLGEQPDAADEALLNRLLKDRAADVRKASSIALMRLPQSAYAQRMFARLDAVLQSAPVSKSWLGKLTGRAAPQWHVDPPVPEKLDAAWLDDQLGKEKPKYERIDDRSYLLAELCGKLPLSHWTEHLQMTPMQLVQWAESSEWKIGLCRGWTQSLLDLWPQDTAWVTALLPHFGSPLIVSRALQRLPMATIESLFGEWSADPAKFGDQMHHLALAAPVDSTFTRDFSLRLATHLASLMDRSDLASRPLHDLKTVAQALHPQGLDLLCASPMHADAAKDFLGSLAPWQRQLKALHDYIATISTSP
jgi:hypothetical protein